MLLLQLLYFPDDHAKCTFLHQRFHSKLKPRCDIFHWNGDLQDVHLEIRLSTAAAAMIALDSKAVLKPVLHASSAGRELAVRWPCATWSDMFIIFCFCMPLLTMDIHTIPDTEPMPSPQGNPLIKIWWSQTGSDLNSSAHTSHVVVACHLHLLCFLNHRS